MEGNLPGYSVNAATWLYLSLLLIVALFFRFGRLWSLRNLDLLLLLSLSPGQLLIRHNPQMGYVWLFAITGLLLVRLFCDTLFERRPRLEQNLNPSGMAFLGLSAFAFLTVSAVTQPPSTSTVETVRRADQLLQRIEAPRGDETSVTGPASSILAAPVIPLANAAASGNGRSRDPLGAEVLAARILAIISHLAVVVGLYLVGRWHFREPQIGLAMAVLYLLLPCTSYDVDKVNHVLPAALIVWAFVAYRRPMVAGGLMGLACGTLFFPVFLLPLWTVFYGRRGGLRFACALALVGAVLLGSFALTAANTHSFVQQTFGAIEWNVLKYTGGRPTGFWRLYDSVYRLPILASFVIMLVGLTIWPRRKNLEPLMAHSTAIIVGVQLWYPQQGGEYLLWYLPLLLLVMFRPRLTHLVPPDFQADHPKTRRAADPARPQRPQATLSARR